jgi:hypothetical protein
LQAVFQATEINLQKNKVVIIRAGGHMNKYENINIIDIFPSIFKNKQIREIKKILLNSNENIMLKSEKNKNKKKKRNENEKQYIYFNFIIEEKEDVQIFYRILKLKLNLILLVNINMIFYLNGIYNIDKDIIVTEQKKDEEIILHFGNKEHYNKYSDKNSTNNLTIKKIKKNKYLGYNKLIKDYNSFVGCKKYSVYHILSVSKNSLNKNNDGKIKISSKKNSIEEVDKTNFYDEKKQLLLFNDVASQASSIASSTSKSVFIYNNKGNKKVKNENDIINKFKIIKITLIITLFVFFGLILFQCIYLIKLHEQIDKRNNIAFWK